MGAPRTPGDVQVEAAAVDAAGPRVSGTPLAREPTVARRDVLARGRVDLRSHGRVGEVPPGLPGPRALQVTEAAASSLGCIDLPKVVF